ncbi:MAG: recombinase family protein [Piscinibacter sp.]|nr:recombinase family protein [Piscinibacter sp.]
MRVALYARFSSDLQRQTSIVDQLRAARDRAAKEGWEVVIERSDEAISGSVPVALRRGGKALLADALAGRFDVLILEGLDRLSRDVGEQDQVVKRLEYRGIRLIGTSDGYDTQAKGRKVMRVARGLVNEMYLDDLRDKTHRGLAGQFERGLSAGGRSYGYRSVEVAGGRQLVVDEAEASTVRFIFESAAAGHSVRWIAHELNARGIKSPRGGSWAVSAIFGSAARGLGMLNNELYIGRVIWNRRQWLKDPETGMRRYVERPPAEWRVREQPELRIVPQDLWDRLHNRARRGPAPGREREGAGASPKTLFGGLLVCPTCGGAVVAINRARYGCSVHKDRGNTVCANGATFPRDRVDQRLVAELRDCLLEPTVLARLQREVREQLRQARRETHADADGLRRRLQALEGEIGRVVEALASVGVSQALTTRLQAAEAEQAAIQRLLEAAAAPAVDDLVDAAVAGCRAKIMQLQQALAEDLDRARTRRVLADLLGPVRLVRDSATGESFAELEEPADRLLLAAVGESLEVVARAGFEPATFGL